MFKIFSKIFLKLYHFCLKFSKSTQKETLSLKNKNVWYSINGDKTLRVEYDLNENSVVFDVGGYEGDWTAEIAARYSCNIYIFEPVPLFFNNIKNRFKQNGKITCFNFGLSSKNENVEIQIIKESSTIFKEVKKINKNNQTENIQLKSFIDIYNNFRLETIDLIKINIEGGEYELLEQIIKTDLIKNIKNIQVQFHDFVPNAEDRMNKIKTELAKTHELTYEYIFVWENWKLKNNL